MNYIISECKNYKQYDTRWASLSYRVKPACMRLNGCGATSLADIIYPIKKVTPKDTRSWLLKHNYVSANQGTYWAGISACMKAYGFERVINHPTMPEFFNEMAKGNRAGIILFRAGTRGGRTFTTGGHFCAIIGYKKVGNRHYLYLYDCGPRNNSYWIEYEREMKGLVLQIWSGKYPDKKKKTTTKKKADKKKTTTKNNTNKDKTSKTETNKNKSTKDNTNKAKDSKSNTKTKKKTNAQKLLETASDTFKQMEKMHFKYSVSGNAYSWKNAKRKKTSNCATYVNYCLQIMGLLPGTGVFYGSQGKVKFQGKLTLDDLEKIATVKYMNKKPKDCDLKPGDICTYKDAPHTQIYAGKQKDGDLEWYSYGPSDRGKKLPRKRGNYNEKRIQHIIRLKEDK